MVFLWHEIFRSGTKWGFCGTKWKATLPKKVKREKNAKKIETHDVEMLAAFFNTKARRHKGEKV
jgi:hypothetical protein